MLSYPKQFIEHGSALIEYI